MTHIVLKQHQTAYKSTQNHDWSKYYFIIFNNVIVVKDSFRFRLACNDILMQCELLQFWFNYILGVTIYIRETDSQFKGGLTGTFGFFGQTNLE